MSSSHHHRCIFLSDLHLGSTGCQADLIMQFLLHNTCDTLYLVGDIIDLWALRRRPTLPASHCAVIRLIIERARGGTHVIYLTGNHDDALRGATPFELAGVLVLDECDHHTADGRHFLIIHGDVFDPVTTYTQWLAELGDVGYTMLLRLNRWLARVRRRLGLPDWSLSAYVKRRCKLVVNFISSYEVAVSAAVKHRAAHGVICGHIHHPECHDRHGITYINIGDGVESCTALVEDSNGALRHVAFNNAPIVLQAVLRPMAA